MANPWAHTRRHTPRRRDPPLPDRSRAARTPRGRRASTGHARADPRPPTDASRSDMEVNASEVAHHDPTNADHNSLETHVARSSRSAPLPSPASRLRLSTSPLDLRTSGRFPGSFFMVLMLLSVPSCLPPPRLRPSHLHAWAALPGVCLQVEEGGSSAKRWTPLPRKPRRTAKSGPEAGRRPVDLQASTPRNQQPGSTSHPGAVCAPISWSVQRGRWSCRAVLSRRPLSCRRRTDRRRTLCPSGRSGGD